MERSLTSPDYTPQFSGHESFHLRYGWLKKAYDQVSLALASGRDPLKVFTDDDAIARFGVGKNMVASIRFWATSCDVLSVEDGKIALGETGKRVLDDLGCDPYLENPNSLWLIHWNLASNVNRTSFFWAFNHFNEATFSKSLMEKKLFAHAEQYGWKKINRSTADKDLAVLLNTYAMPALSKKSSQEDSLSSPLAELGLLRQSPEDKKYHFGWGLKPTLCDELFLFALLQFWQRFSDANTLNIQSIMLEPGSPGRVFLMDENELSMRLMRLSELTMNALAWSETAGLRQIVRSKEITVEKAWAHVTSSINSHHSKAA
ncbi:DUF4007 family protein [Kordiimonas sp.]|uniref:DUF4007 family protein n=1 Tax=Kordiimonas sp. TaxID=1970157 RepID=UPI003A95A325